LEKIAITVTSPFEIEYRSGTKDLMLKGVDPRVGGFEYLIQLDPVATRALLRSLMNAEKATGEPVGEDPKPRTRH
jgi:hypothetical protein